MEFGSLKDENYIELQKKAIKEEIDNKKNEVFILFGKGSSMWPNLLEKDVLYFRRTKESDNLNIGDIVVYLNENGKMVCHRIIKIQGNYFLLMGDSNYILSKPKIEDCEKLSKNEILGILVFLKRNNRIIKSFTNKNKNVSFQTKIKFRIIRLFARIRYHGNRFLRSNIFPNLMILINRNSYFRNKKKIKFIDYIFFETKLENSKVMLKIYLKEIHIGTIYYRLDETGAIIYKMSVKMRNFGKGLELVGIKYLKKKGIKINFELKQNSMLDKYFSED